MAGRWLAPGEFKEIIQIGAVRLNSSTLKEEAALNLIVRPRINGIISEYLTQLTGITNDRLMAEGIDFAVAYQRFLKFCGLGSLCAFGRDDLVLLENLRLYGLKPDRPLPPYVNAVDILRRYGIDPAGKHACHVGPLCGAAFHGHEHDALDDARSVAAGLRALLDRNDANPFWI